MHGLISDYCYFNILVRRGKSIFRILEYENGGFLCCGIASNQTIIDAFQLHLRVGFQQVLELTIFIDTGQ